MKKCNLILAIILLFPAALFAQHALCDSGLVSLVLGNVVGEKNERHSVPVRIKPCEDVISLQASFHIADSSLVRIDSVWGFGLSGLNVGNFQLTQTNNTLTFAWTEPSIIPISITTDSIIFFIDITLKGPSGQQTFWVVDDTPTQRLAGLYNGGNLLTDSLCIETGSIQIGQMAPLEPLSKAHFFDVYAQGQQLYLQQSMQTKELIEVIGINSTGSICLTHDFLPAPANTRFILNLSFLNPGCYMLIIRYKEQAQIQKIILY